MHFSKTFAQLLLDLPPELRDNAIQYRELKKLINQVVRELSGLGLDPSLLHELMILDGEEGGGSGASASVKKGDEGAIGINGHTTLDSTTEAPREALKLSLGDSKGDAVNKSTSDEDRKEASDSMKASISISSPDERHLSTAHAPTTPNPVTNSKMVTGEGCPPIKECLVQLPVEGTHPDSDYVSISSEESGMGPKAQTNGSKDSLPPSIAILPSTSSEPLPSHDEPTSPRPQVVYELNDHSGKIEPKLRLRLPVQVKEQGDDVIPGAGAERDGLSSMEEVNESLVSPASRSLVWALQRGNKADELPDVIDSPPQYREIIIPLASDTVFFNTLSTALDALSKHLTAVHDEFVQTLEQLAVTIGETARPVSELHTAKRVGGLHSPDFVSAGKSDLPSWRDIFQLYIESEVFESTSEIKRGDLPVEESDKRLRLFVERITQRGLGDSRKLKLKKSRDALETFLQLNLFILNIKKFQFANSEATRKILKKHAKRTALPLALLPSGSLRNISRTKPDLSNYIVLLNKRVSSTGSATTINWLPKAFVQAIGEILLPIIPHLDDYACLICTTIAFKPIRLNCGHLFCVRCLVKMQKRGYANCPMCRAPNVLIANRSNVDWAMLNFMRDWFAEDVTEKLALDSKEIQREELEEMGLDPDSKCIIC